MGGTWITGGSASQLVNGASTSIVTIGELGAFINETYSATFLFTAVLRNLTVAIDGQTPNPVTFTVFRNGVATSLTCMIQANAPPPEVCTDITHPETFMSGQQFSIHALNNYPGKPVHFRVLMQPQ